MTLTVDVTLIDDGRVYFDAGDTCLGRASLDRVRPADEPSVIDMLAELARLNGEVTLSAYDDGTFSVPWAHRQDYPGETPEDAIRAAFEAVTKEPTA